MKKYIGSLRYRMILAVMGMSIPAIMLLFALNAYAVNQIQQQLYSSNLNLMTVHLNQLEMELKAATDILLSETIKTDRIERFSSSDVQIKNKAIIEYHREHSTTLSRFEMLEGQIIYSSVNDSMIAYFQGLDSDYERRKNVADYVKENAGKLISQNGQWVTCEINNEKIFIGAAGNEKVLFCFWTTYDLLLKPVQEWEIMGNGTFLFTGSNGEIYSKHIDKKISELSFGGDLQDYYFRGKGKQYLICGIDGRIGDFRLISVVERRKLLGAFFYIQIIGSLMLVLVFLAGIPSVIHLLNKCVFNPLDRVEKGIHDVEAGNMDTQIVNNKSSREMEHLIRTFNEFINQIHDLKIQSYEENLERQRLEMDYLNLQIEPHFFLNALNVINVTAQLGDTRIIQNMSENLSQYMRYLVGSRKKTATIEEELAHVGHYLKIMEIRLGEGFSYKEDIDRELLLLEIPPLMIQTLVENSMKYAFDVYRETMIEVRVKHENEHAVITVLDNGDGYSADYLEWFYHNVPPEGGHIGIMNLKSRLEMMYGNRVVIIIKNGETHGAYTEIKIAL